MFLGKYHVSMQYINIDKAWKKFGLITSFGFILKVMCPCKYSSFAGEMPIACEISGKYHFVIATLTLFKILGG